MILISHRGNINGKNLKLENNPDYIIKALSLGYNCEIDLRYIYGHLFLGHDKKEYEIDQEFIKADNLWIHCKSIETLEYLKHIKFNGEYFWHQYDDVTLTSNGYLWTLPGKYLTKYSIAVLPEVKKFENIEKCYGICSDYVINYKILC
jgi:hypothetical protein